MTKLSRRERTELEWLARQTLPMWGGHIMRGDPLYDDDMRSWLNRGLIKRVEGPQPGYVITLAGRAALTDAERKEK